MLRLPTSSEEAIKLVYGSWAGNEKGDKYVCGRCAYEVYPVHGWIPHQCHNKNGKGINGLYCAIHAKKVK